MEFSPDGRTLVYDSERDGLWQLFTAKIKDRTWSASYLSAFISTATFAGADPGLRV